MKPQVSPQETEYIAHAREVFIRLGLLTLLGAGCFVLLRPFIQMIVSSIIIAVAVYPGYRILKNTLGGRKKLAATLCTTLMLIVVIVPCVLLAGTLAGGIRTMALQLGSGQISIPPPPPRLQTVPIVGSPLQEFWSSCSTNLSGAVSRFSPQIRERIPRILSASAGLGGSLLQFLVSILIAGFLLGTSEQNQKFADVLFARVFDDKAAEYGEIVAATVRSVTNGILGVALIQSVFASLGFWMVGLPGAGLWALFFLIASVLQVSPLVLVPAALYVFAVFPTSNAVLFLIWCIVVGSMDNILKPFLLGRGSKVPMAVIFIGVLGGFMTMGLIGLFVGAIVLSVGYKLFIAWLETGSSGIVADEVSVVKAAS